MPIEYAEAFFFDVCLRPASIFWRIYNSCPTIDFSRISQFLRHTIYIYADTSTNESPDCDIRSMDVRRVPLRVFVFQLTFGIDFISFSQIILA